MTQPRISVVIPAYNEERFLPRCMASIERAAARLQEPVEVIVVDNLSSDQTPAIAREGGAKVVVEGRKCLSAIRNRGAAEAGGDFLAFIDADTRMSENMLVEIERVLDSGKYIGGGVANVKCDRMSPGILFSALTFLPFALLRIRASCCLFYTRRETFHEVGGFDETIYAAEDIEFGNRLRRIGKRRALKYKNLWSAHVITSVRKFDEFGDWFLVKHPGIILKVFGNDREVANKLWYRPRR